MIRTIKQPPVFSPPDASRYSLRTLVIQTLSDDWPLNGRQVYLAVKEKFSISPTYQGVHKVLRQLLDDGVLSYKDKKYQLNTNWIKEMKQFGEDIERKYSGRKGSLKYVEAGTGASSDPDPAMAGKNAARQALEELGKRPDFAFVFCHGATFAKSDESINALVSAMDVELKKKNPNCRWVGCTTDGEISDKGCTFNSCVVMALSSEHISFGVGIGDNAGKDFFSAGKRAAEAATADLKLIDAHLERYMQFLAVKRKQPQELLKIKPYILLTIFPGPVRNYSPNEEDLLEGIKSVTGILPLMGGSASDSAMFRQTFQFANGHAYKDACVVVALMSDLKLAFSVKHGLTPTKKQALVTKAQGNTVFTLSGKPAAKVYAKMLGLSMPELKKKLFDVVIQWPFGIADPLGQYWIKTPFQINKDYSLTFLNKVPQNSLLVFMYSNPKTGLAATEAAIAEVKEKLGTDPALLLVFDCGSRPRMLQNNGCPPGAEHEIFKKELPGSRIIGAYTHGEQALIPSGTIGQHNQTIVMLGIANELIGE
ncbi:FIST N domain protein [Candidatus Burarchaeum australiense]|nr:FIST N domain protein [Candidatus Burarchaeum australiense]